MFDRICNLFGDLCDYMPTVLAFLVCALICVIFIAIGVGVIGGIYCLFGWILMGVWNAIAYNFNLPTFNYWVYVGILIIIHFIKWRLSISASAKNT